MWNPFNPINSCRQSIHLQVVFGRHTSSSSRTSSFFRLPVSGQSLSRSDLCGRHSASHLIADSGIVLLLITTKARSLEAHPHMCSHAVLPHTLAVVVHEANV